MFEWPQLGHDVIAGGCSHEARWLAAGGSDGRSGLRRREHGGWVGRFGAAAHDGVGRAEATAHFAEHAGAVEAGLWLFGLGAVALLWWFGAVYQWMTRTERSAGLACTSLAGFAIGGALSFASSAVWAAAALMAADPGDMARALSIVGWELRAASGFGLAIHLLATNALAVRDRSLHLWFVGAGALAAIGFLISGVAASVSTSGAADLAGPLAVVLYSVWVLGVSHRLWWWDTSTDARSADPAAALAA